MAKLIQNSKGSQGVKRNPVNYTSAGNDLSSHLKGIDDALANENSGNPDVESGTYEPELTYGENTSEPPAGGTANHGFYTRIGKIVQGMVNVRVIVTNANTDSYFDVALPKTPAGDRPIMMGNHGTFYANSKGGVVDFSASGSNNITMKLVNKDGGTNQLMVCELSFCYEII